MSRGRLTAILLAAGVIAAATTLAVAALSRPDAGVTEVMVGSSELEPQTSLDGPIGVPVDTGDRWLSATCPSAAEFEVAGEMQRCEQGHTFVPDLIRSLCSPSDPSPPMPEHVLRAVGEQIAVPGSYDLLRLGDKLRVTHPGGSMTGTLDEVRLSYPTQEAVDRATELLRSWGFEGAIVGEVSEDCGMGGEVLLPGYAPPGVQPAPVGPATTVP